MAREAMARKGGRVAAFVAPDPASLRYASWRRPVVWRVCPPPSRSSWRWAIRRRSSYTSGTSRSSASRSPSRARCSRRVISPGSVWGPDGDSGGSVMASLWMAGRQEDYGCRPRATSTASRPEPGHTARPGDAGTPIVTRPLVVGSRGRLHVPYLPLRFFEDVAVDAVVAVEPGARVAPIAPEPDQQRRQEDRGDHHRLHYPTDDRHFSPPPAAARRPP